MVSINPCVQAYISSYPRIISAVTTYSKGSLMDIINSNPDFTIFSGIVKKAKYDVKLSSQQAVFTVFVPSDVKIRERYSLNFLNNIDVGLATEILNYSMMNRSLDKNLLQSPNSMYPSVNRSLIHFKTIGNLTIINGGIHVIHWNQPATNGIIHVVDDILIPFNQI